MKAPQVEIVDIPLDHIQPDEFNVNEMADAKYRALRAEIEARGFVQPVLVRPVEPSSAAPAIAYQIVDGEHRWMALQELGSETCPCVVINADETEAQVRSLIMNGIRGNFVPIRMAHLLADLAERIPPEELQDRLALDRGEMRDLLDLSGYLDEEPEDDGDKPETERPSGVEVAVVATQKQAAKVHKLLDGLTGEDPERNAAVVARKAREFLASA